MGATFAERLAEARTEMGIGSSEASRRMGVSPSTYYNWEHGISKPQNMEMRNKLADVFGVTETWLSTGLGEKSAKRKDEVIMQAKIEKKDKAEFCVRSKDVRMLQDIEFVIQHLRDINASRDEKEACYLTLAEIRNDIECRVVLGVRPTSA